MSLTSFLSGAPMTYSQGLSQSSTTLPDWYTQYTQGILNDASQFAAQGAPQYPGPRVADLNPMQTGAASTAVGQTGVGSGIAQQGVNDVNGALAQPNAFQAGSPYLSSANAGVGSALAQPNASQAASPYLSGASAGVSGALAQPNASQAAQPYLSAAASPLSAGMGQFMNPYIGSVINANDAISARNFNQNVLPGLQDQFTQAGQVYGGSRQGYEAALLGSQEQQNESALNAGLLSQGFNTALGGAQAQAGIDAGLASTAAGAANSAQNTGLTGAGINAGIGSTAGNLANATQNTGLSGAGIQAGLGATAGSLANSAQGTGIAGGTALGNLGTTEQNNALTQAQVQNSFGQQQQANTQQNLTTGYQDYLQQYYNPLIGSQAMQGALQGIQVPMGQTNYSYQPYGLGQSPLQSSVGLGNTIGNLWNNFAGNNNGMPVVNARGGHIRLARGGPARRPTLSLPTRQAQWRPLALPHYRAA